jgi:4-alpha-glucanotransferase
VAYLGTHDNGTTRGWFESLLLRANQEGPVSAAAREELRRLQGYTGITRTVDVSGQLIRTLMASPAGTVILTTQDLLDQGDEHRMNIPGVAAGNWTYRLTIGQLTQQLAEDLRQITTATERC